LRLFPPKFALAAHIPKSSSSNSAVLGGSGCSVPAKRSCRQSQGEFDGCSFGAKFQGTFVHAMLWFLVE
jgi:hypothetical protein